MEIPYELASHHALGGGSYVFKTQYPAYVRSLLPTTAKRIEVNIIIQPNSSPHIGTLSSIVLAFVLARRLKDIGSEALVRCDLWDRTKGEQVEIDGVQYQRSVRATGHLTTVMPDYEYVLQLLSARYNVDYRIRFEDEFLRQPGVGEILQRILRERGHLGPVLMPHTGRLAVRAACLECGLVDKYGMNNVYAADHQTITFHCPSHGDFMLDVMKDTHRFQFNCQLFNLILGRFYEAVDFGWIEICGSDYAGFWQEQLLLRFLKSPPVIVYTPLICDWSGSKISKSLYIQPNAYKYLKLAGQEYLLSYSVFRREGKSLEPLLKEVELWVDEPYRLFRAYSIHYMHMIFHGEEIRLGVIHGQ